MIGRLRAGGNEDLMAALASAQGARLSDYGWRWLAIALVACVALIGMGLMGVTLQIATLRPHVSALATFLALLPVYLLFQRMSPSFGRLVGIPIDLTLSIAQLSVLVLAFLPVSYMAAALGRHIPVLDETLALIDARLFGFYWDPVAQWVAAQPILERALSLAYFSLPAQALMLLVLGSLLRPGERNGELLWIAIVSMAITSVVSIFTPALGKIGHVGTGYLDVLNELRSGAWRSFSYDKPEGIVTFPSFHTSLAFIFAYVAWRLHLIAAVLFGALNFVMLLSVPPIGGHYLIDLFGGALVALVSIGVVYRLRERGRIRPTAALLAPAAAQTIAPRPAA